MDHIISEVEIWNYLLIQVAKQTNKPKYPVNTFFFFFKEGEEDPCFPRVTSRDNFWILLEQYSVKLVVKNVIGKVSFCLRVLYTHRDNIIYVYIQDWAHAFIYTSFQNSVEESAKRINWKACWR